MNIKDASITTSELIAAVSSDLTPAERRIAEAVLTDPTLLAFGTVSDLANRIGTSRPTIVRFANKLGFHGYTPLQQHVRNDLSHKLTRPRDRIRRGNGELPPARMEISNAISSVFMALDGQRLNELAAPLVTASNVWVLSGETSQAGALAFHSGLSMVRPGVRILEEHSFGANASEAGPGDAVVIFDFYRYRRQVTNAARIFADAGATIVAITDSPLSPLVEVSDVWCEIEIPAVGPFDSSVPVVAMAELLVSQVATSLKEDATERIDRIEALWESTEVFL